MTGLDEGAATMPSGGAAAEDPRTRSDKRSFGRRNCVGRSREADNRVPAIFFDLLGNLKPLQVLLVRLLRSVVCWTYYFRRVAAREVMWSQTSVLRSNNPNRGGRA